MFNPFKVNWQVLGQLFAIAFILLLGPAIIFLIILNRGEL
uniref:Photosystem II reaction center protein Psb30 n=1 Tax=Astrosyne radiata TaxID=1158023 RepID=A0A2U9NT22_9STRA|nr:hypothetical chloroplast RF12 [Astrosyne radiata]AWT40277.1 hypothetical chloroplast RF12 [Astrosyne radiata]